MNTMYLHSIGGSIPVLRVPVSSLQIGEDGHIRVFYDAPRVLDVTTSPPMSIDMVGTIQPGDANQHGLPMPPDDTAEPSLSDSEPGEYVMVGGKPFRYQREEPVVFDEDLPASAFSRAGPPRARQCDLEPYPYRLSREGFYV